MFMPDIKTAERTFHSAMLLIISFKDEKLFISKKFSKL